MMPNVRCPGVEVALCGLRDYGFADIETERPRLCSQDLLQRARPLGRLDAFPVAQLGGE